MSNRAVKISAEKTRATMKLRNGGDGGGNGSLQGHARLYPNLHRAMSLSRSFAAPFFSPSSVMIEMSPFAKNNEHCCLSPARPRPSVFGKNMINGGAGDGLVSEH